MVQNEIEGSMAVTQKEVAAEVNTERILRLEEQMAGLQARFEALERKFEKLMAGMARTGKAW